MPVYHTYRPVGPDGMFSTCDSDQPMADGPVGRFITRSPVGLDGMLSTCDPDRPVADDPVGQSFILGPVGPRRMFSQCKPNQPVAVGPVGQSFTTGPVGPYEMVSNYKQMDRTAYSPVGSTVIPDPVEQTESPIQTDFMEIVTTDGPASLGDTPPSSDSGIHSLGEQWENMSISTVDMESEQNGRPTNCSPTGRHGSDTRVPPNTEEDEDIICPRMDCLLNEESDEFSSIDIPNYRKDIQYNDVTICRKENSSVNSGTDGGNSDVGVLADFLADEEVSRVEQISGCRIPGCQCKGRIENMEWGSEDMTDTDDSEWEDPDERENRLYVERYNFDLIEGMTHLTYTPPPRKNRQKWYEDDAQYTPEMLEEIRRINEMGFRTDEDLPQWEQAFQQTTDADEDIPSCRDNKDNSGSQKQAGSDMYFPSGEDSGSFDLPVTESVTAPTESDTNFPRGEEDSEFFGRPVTEPVTSRAGSDTDLPSDEHSEFFRPTGHGVGNGTSR